MTNNFVGTSLALGPLEFAARLSQINASVANEIKAGKRDVYDYTMYVTRWLASDSTVELFKAADDKEVGLTNINSRQLEDKNFFLVKGIQILYAERMKTASSGTGLEADPFTSETDAKNWAKTAEFKKIDYRIANGEIELKLGEKSLLPRMSCEVFRKDADNGHVEGMHILEAPKMIKPLTDIIPWLYTPASLGGNVVVKTVLYGVRNN